MDSDFTADDMQQLQEHGFVYRADQDAGAFVREWESARSAWSVEGSINIYHKMTLGTPVHYIPSLLFMLANEY